MNYLFLVFFILFVIIILYLYYYYTLYQFKLKRILPYININDKILDLGCGSCYLTKKIQNKGYNIIGIDVVNKSKYYNPLIFNGKIIPFKNKSFDVTISSFVLHHIIDCENMLDEIIRVTKKYILIFEDTPSTKIDKYLSTKHSQSHWGTSNCFKNCQQWIHIFKSKKLKIININKLYKWESPFSYKPFIYPISKTFFCLKV